MRVNYWVLLLFDVIFFFGIFGVVWLCESFGYGIGCVLYVYYGMWKVYLSFDIYCNYFVFGKILVCLGMFYNC